MTAFNRDTDFSTPLPIGGSVRPPRAGRLPSLEIGRGLAALAVVMFHANAGSRLVGGPDLHWMRALEHGVDFFFVLSGFIIFAAHADDIGKRGQILPYLLKRGIRLFPLLWLVVIGYAALRILAGDTVDPMTLLRSLLPWPTLEDGAPVVVWTLRHEWLFYAVFALLIWRPATGWPVLFLWVAGSLLQIALVLAGAQGFSGSAAMIFSSYTIDFAFGLALGLAFRHRNFRSRWLALYCGIGLLCMVLWLEESLDLNRHGVSDYLSLGALIWTPVLGAAFAIIVFGLLCVDRYISSRNWLISLGSASYAIYLVHTPVNAVLLRGADFLPATLVQQGFLYPLLIGGGVGAGFALHYGFERPVSAWLKRRLLPRRTTERNTDTDGTVSVAHAKRSTDTIR